MTLNDQTPPRQKLGKPTDPAQPVWFDKAIRKARVGGIQIGLALGVAVFTLGMAAHASIDMLWPPACDGIGPLPSCAIQIIGTEP